MRRPAEPPSHNPVVAFRQSARAGKRPARSWLRRGFALLDRVLIPVALLGAFGLAAMKHGDLPILAAALPADPPAHSLTYQPDRVTVVDGDTIRIPEEHRAIRLVGFNAPESRDPQCPAEGALGQRAKTRLKELVATSRIDFSPVACACRPGTEGTSSCNYGRACGTLRADGEDVGDILIAEGLAVPFHCRGTGCPRTPRPWCG
ncbi:MAG: thermonuclease family protein [Bauldia sp.]